MSAAICTCNSGNMCDARKGATLALYAGLLYNTWDTTADKKKLTFERQTSRRGSKESGEKDTTEFFLDSHRYIISAYASYRHRFVGNGGS
jgi:hypothetical protein